jgi:hypothetical protein
MHYVDRCGLKKTHLSLAISPEVHAQPNSIVDGRVSRLVQQRSRESRHGQHDQPGLDAPVQGRAGNEAKRPLPGDHEDAEDEVDDLQEGEGLDGAVEVLGQEVPEYLGPEEAFKGGCYLVCCVC